MMERRAFLASALGAAALASYEAQAEGAAAQRAAAVPPPEPVVWPVVGKVRSGITSLAGHTDTVPDIVGRIGTPASLVVFTEGNHLMALLSDEIVGAFPAWARSQSQYADLDMGNVVVVTLPQPIVVEMVRTGGIALGNLTLDVTRASGFYPDIVLGGAAPLSSCASSGCSNRRRASSRAIAAAPCSCARATRSASTLSATSRARERVSRRPTPWRRVLARETARPSKG